MIRLSALETRIGYVFKDKELLKTAFTHSTYAEKYGVEDNERMEYLGDSVLQLIVSKLQYFSSERHSEGEMTKIRQKLVCTDALLRCSKRLGLTEFLLYVGSESNVGDKTVSSLYETLIAAIYLDGGIEEAERFITANYPIPATEENFIGELQEYLQKYKLPEAEYAIEKSGLDHDPLFHCTATAAGKSAQGVGKSKPKAKQQAAKTLLTLLKTLNYQEKQDKE